MMAIAFNRAVVLGAVCFGLAFAAFAIEGPFVEFLTDDTVRIRWRSAELCRAGVAFDETDGLVQTKQDASVSRDHAVTVRGVKRPCLYRFRIRQSVSESSPEADATYQFDSALDYLPIPPAAGSSPYPRDGLTALYEKAAENALRELDCRQGYCLVLGGGEGRLAFEIARRSDLQVVAVEEGAEQAGRARRLLRQAKVYGARVSVHHGRLDALPYGSRIFNLIVSDTMLRTGGLPTPASEMHRLLRPYGGVLYLGQWGKESQRRFERGGLDHWLARAPVSSRDGRFDEQDGLFWIYRRGALPRAGQWTHQYASGANTACSDDELIQGDLGIAWWGRPGPRPMPDRGSHSPAPLSCNGRLFVQGDRVLFGLDAYNGAKLWSLQIPGYRRLNMVHDSSNLAAADDALYLGGGPHCLALDARTGQPVRRFSVPGHEGDFSVDWGFVGCQGEALLGSAIPRGAAAPQVKTEKVVSLSLFALDRAGGQCRWIYERGLIVNSTITFDRGTIYFIELRSPAPEARGKGKINGGLIAELQPHLVALDLRSGQRNWERPCDFGQFVHAAYLCLGGPTLIAAGSDGPADKRKRLVPACHTYAFDTADGRLLWERHEPDRKGHHSGWLGHPVIVGEQLVHNMQFLDLRGGQVLREDNYFTWHGCGTASASSHAVFRRYQHLGMWDVHTGGREELFSVRSGCWLNAIPAGGMLLVPEASSGCVCSAYALQTSVAFAPRETTLRFAHPVRDFLEATAVELIPSSSASEVRYTLDGTEPGPDSPRYAGPIRLTDTKTLSAAEFLGATRLGKSARATFTRLSPRDPVEVANATPGLIVELYSGSYLYYQSAILNRMPSAAGVAQDVSAATKAGLDMVGPGKAWHDRLLRLTGYLDVPRDGVYEFFTTSGEYSALFAAGLKLVDTFDFKHSTIERSGRVALRAGKHALVVLYGSKSEHRGQIDLIVEYQGPGLPRQRLPAAALSH